MAAWIYQPVMFESSRAFDCEGFDADQCQYYKEPWHNWYVADWTFALPTIALFMCIIGIFVIGNVLTNVLTLSRKPEPWIWRRGVAVA
ncbi:hypothetical protein PVAG01_10195 [Phlyctema vagabunda]|uniref:Uncharacterized protein n=1 Tax=Phlyctema vagabunda TaxID=108571 RepID=A0ABR4P592_9HELO